MNISVRKQRSK